MGWTNQYIVENKSTAEVVYMFNHRWYKISGLGIRMHTYTLTYSYCNGAETSICGIQYHLAREQRKFEFGFVEIRLNTL